MNTSRLVTSLSFLAFASLSHATLAASTGLNHSGMYLTAHAEAVDVIDNDITINGVNNGDANFDTGFGLGGAMGYDLADLNIRLEAELTYRGNDATLRLDSPAISRSDVSDTMALMANIYYDMDFQLPIIPYVGLGAGAIDIDGDETVFAYQAMAGFSLPLTDRHDIYAGYRYLGTDGVSSTSNSVTLEHDYKAHIAEVGFRVYF